jgi:biotin transport system substrate-specific component
MTSPIENTPVGWHPGTLLSRLASSADSTLTTASIRAAAVLFVTVLTTAAAQVSVPLPFTPVPFTFQPMVVLLGAAALGSRLGAASQVLYLAAGIAGLPVFAASPLLPQGAARLLGPTGGYLLSYPLAAFVVGYLAERGLDRRYLGSVLAMLTGLAIVFALGVLRLSFFLSPANPSLGLDTAATAGLYPFVGADVVKVLIAAGALPALWKLTGLGRVPTGRGSAETDTAGTSRV